MQYLYHTKSGSIYVHTVDACGDDWFKLDNENRHMDLAGAVHLTRKRLQTLITDYPIKALDRTACFGKAVAREFFDDVKREGAVQVPETEESTIFFLVEREGELYSIGFSSRVVKVETIDFEKKRICDILIK